MGLDAICDPVINATDNFAAALTLASVAATDLDNAQSKSGIFQQSVLQKNWPKQSQFGGPPFGLGSPAGGRMTFWQIRCGTGIFEKFLR